MGALRGPLGDHKNYMRFIALPNAMEYFDFVKKMEEEKPERRDQFDLVRHFLNAIESMSNIPEWMFHDDPTHFGALALGEFLARVRENHPCLAALADLANAYKHCVRGRDDRKTKRFERDEDARHGGDLSPTETLAEWWVTPDADGATVDSVSVTLRFTFPGVMPEDDEVLSEAWRFWIDYENDKQTIDTSKKCPPT